VVKKRCSQANYPWCRKCHIPLYQNHKHYQYAALNHLAASNSIPPTRTAPLAALKKACHLSKIQGKDMMSISPWRLPWVGGHHLQRKLNHHKLLQLQANGKFV
jgi:hypothetical protein